MRLLLVTATRREMISALQPFSRPEELPYGMPVEWSVQERPCLLLITGIGPINSAMHLAGTLARAEPVAGVLNLGIGGSFDLPGLPLLQICSVQEEIWPEFGLWTDHGLNSRALKFPLGKSRGRSVWDRIELEPESAADEMGLKLPRAWSRVRSVSVAGVSGTMDKAVELRQRYGADLENMEGFALGWACLQAGVPFLECRSVSNLVGSRRDEDWDLRGALGMLGQALACLL